jgi:hypothetical protein
LQFILSGENKVRNAVRMTVPKPVRLTKSDDDACGAGPLAWPDDDASQSAA